jgi:hypothetical protein
MPIKPENRRRYPANWPEIRERIRARSGNRCEWCGVENRAVGYREDDGSFVMLGRSPVEAAMACDAAEEDGRKVIRIVLTVAHVHDHRPEACDLDNLAHLCQRCHNRHDKDMRQRNAATTRREGKALGDLFEETTASPLRP